MNALLQSEFCGRLCWALAHSLWQAGAVAIVAGAMAFALRRSSANARYNVYLAGLLVALSAFPATLVWLRQADTVVVTESIAEPAIVPLPVQAPVTIEVPEIAAPIVEPPAPIPPPSLAPQSSLLTPPFTPRLIAAAYLLGVLAMALRLALGMWSASSLSRRATLAAVPLQSRLAHLAQQWNLHIVPRLAVSAEVLVPKVVGILRPTILLPLSAATGLAPDQLDMILAHELAHVRRHDLWVNLLQRIAETLLFFNPAIWYLSRRLTTLREFACDELVCANTPTARYAAALVRVAELSRPRAAAEIAAIAATGRSPSELRRRVARLVGEPVREPVGLTPGGAVAVVALVLLAVATPLAWTNQAEKGSSDDSSTGQENFTKKLDNGTQVELVAIGTHQEHPQQWWQPDGSPLTSVPFRIEGGKVFPQEGQLGRELVFRVKNLPEGASYIRRAIQPSGDFSADGEVIIGDKTPAEFQSLVFSLPNDKTKFAFRVGIAAGEWETVSDTTPTGGNAFSGSDAQVVFSEALAKGDDTVIFVSHNLGETDNRVVAIDKTGKLHTPGRSKQFKAGNVNQSTFTFMKLKLADIERFMFQKREYEWVEFDELPVNADEGKRAVKFGENHDGHELALQVVGPDGKPVPHAPIQIQSTPVLEAEQILDGTFVSGDKWRVTVKTNDDGRATLHFSKQPSGLVMSVRHPGFGPYYAQWSSEVGPQEIPSEFTFELEGAYSIGGIIVDKQGNPIEGVEVKPWIPSKRRPGDNEEIGSGMRTKTDATGTWRIDSVPNSMNEVHFEISHPKYKPLRRPLTRGEFAILEGETPSKQIALEQGLIVIGTVTDEAGKPIVGALVRTKFLNDIREAKTDGTGFYQLIGCEPRMARVVVSAKGRALDMKEVRVAADMEPVNFQMNPGGKIRVRVVDENGKPIPKTRIFFQRWRGQQIDYFEFDHVNQYADENGIWEWNEAPLDEFQADICPPGGMQLTYEPLISREEEYVLQPPSALVVSGSVIDAETKQPVKKFRVVPGTRESSTLWARRESLEAADGKYQIRQTRGSAAGHLIRIEADGYQPAVSRDIKSNEGNVTVDFELQRGKNVAAQVLTPDEKPAVGAKVALGVAKSQISVRNGEIDDGSTYAARLDTDETGRFSFPPQETDYQLVITHPSGYAHVKAKPDAPPEQIQLIPWARVEGTFRVAKIPQANVKMDLYSDPIRSYGEGVASIGSDHNVTTGPDGRFVFPRVFPGDGWVGRNILLMVDDGATEVTSSARIKGHFPAGKTTEMDLGSEGQAVIGRLEPPDDFNAKVLWNFALVNARADPPPPVHPTMPLDVQALSEKRSAWWSEFLRTDEGKKALPIYQAFDAIRSSKPYFTATVAPDGTFRIDDMPEGEYSLSVRFSDFGAGRIQNLRFVVPPPTDEPLDLGVLKLER